MTLQPRWRKVIKDLWGNKVRTGLVVLSIAIGVFAIGMILSSDVMLRQDLTANYLETEPAHAVLFVSPFDDELVGVARNVPGVRVAEGRREIDLRVQTGPEQWKSVEVRAVSDFEAMSVSKVSPEAGAWPPPSDTLMVERASLPLINAEVGKTVVVRQASGDEREMLVSGLAHDVSGPPARFTGEPGAYIAMPTLEWLGYDETYSELHLLVEGDATDKTTIEAVAADVKDKIEKAGYTVYRTRVPEPGEHPVQEIIDPMLLILGVLGALSLFASCFLVINIINGLMSQQTQQIGVMKAVGARRRQIAQMYLVAILALGLVALFIAIPLGGLAAYGFTGYIASLLNFDLNGFRIPLSAVAVMVMVGLLVPVLAALVPVINGSRVTVREALSSYGLGRGQFGGNLLDRGLSWVTAVVLHFSRPMQISLRNSIRRKARLLLTLLTLTLGGAIFIGITSVHASLLKTLDEALAYFAYDVELNFDREYRIEELTAVAEAVPGVTEADSWVGAGATRQRPDGSEGDGFPVLGTRAETEFVNPQLLEGRWLRPDDRNAIVINTDVAESEAEDGAAMHVGDTIRLDINDREEDWQIVGLVQGVMTGPIAYVNRPALERELRQIGRASSVQIIGDDHSPVGQRALAADLKTTFEAAGFQVGTTGTISDVRERIEFQFSLIVFFLAVMALLIAAVGGLGLMGTMSINVLERTREIGVMRAVGASDGSVLRIVLVEGIFVGLISWFLAALIGYPIGRILSDLVGNSLLNNPLSYTYAFNGAIGWLAAVLAIAALASLFPAWRASRLSVRQTLAYE
jgi:putative ABC transport system permease protein